MVNGIPHAGLRGQVDNHGGVVLRKQTIHQGFIRDAALDKHMPHRRCFCRLLDQGQAVLFQLRVIIVIHIVQGDHSAAAQLFQQAEDQVCPDKAGGTGDQDRFVIQVNMLLSHDAHLVIPQSRRNRSRVYTFSSTSSSALS
ncbi:hypothetical protein SDC9_178514 [bioreactor metagenome]|uniref:Uncharacterized protein n=1 Tax=bioreactor metagenome TaxID=1076179 RepID=A0A645H5C1_9ZZZZ